VDLGRYVLAEEVLGEGASAVVRLGYEKLSQKKVAIKIVPKLVETGDLGKVEKRKKSISNEINILRYLSELEDKVNCAQLLEVIDSETVYYLVFEYRSGSLHSFVKKRHHFAEEDAKKLFGQLVQAVAFLHRHRIAHRDIKVENILLDDDLGVSLCDFGFALHVTPGVKSTEWCGSPFTVSPEILQRVPYSPEAVDVWALGSVLYTILCGFFPFHASTPAEVYERTKQGRFHTFPAHVSRAARDLVSRCLTVDAGKRISVSHILKHPFFWSDDDEAEEDDDLDAADVDEGECSGESCASLSEEKESGERFPASDSEPESEL